jgi:hypothetical protein
LLNLKPRRVEVLKVYIMWLGAFLLAVGMALLANGPLALGIFQTTSNPLWAGLLLTPIGAVILAFGFRTGSRREQISA